MRSTLISVCALLTFPLLVVALHGQAPVGVVTLQPIEPQCEVTETDGKNYAYIQVTEDGAIIAKPIYYPATSLDVVKALCRDRIQKIQSGLSAPITTGPVDLAEPVPVDTDKGTPTPDEQALADFQIKVKKARALIGIVPQDSAVLAKLASDIEASLEAHPEYLDSI